MADEAQRKRQAAYRARNRAKLSAKEGVRQAEIRAGERVERQRLQVQQTTAQALRESELLLAAYDGNYDAMCADWQQESVKKGLRIGQYNKRRRRLASRPPPRDD